jgi:hypothetical protein
VTVKDSTLTVTALEVSLALGVHVICTGRKTCSADCRTQQQPLLRLHLRRRIEDTVQARADSVIWARLLLVNDLASIHGRRPFPSILMNPRRLCSPREDPMDLDSSNPYQFQMDRIHWKYSRSCWALKEGQAWLHLVPIHEMQELMERVHQQSTLMRVSWILKV